MARRGQRHPVPLARGVFAPAFKQSPEVSNMARPAINKPQECHHTCLFGNKTRILHESSPSTEHIVSLQTFQVAGECKPTSKPAMSTPSCNADCARGPALRSHMYLSSLKSLPTGKLNCRDARFMVSPGAEKTCDGPLTQHAYHREYMIPGCGECGWHPDSNTENHL